MSSIEAPPLQFDNVSKSFGDFRALERITFEVQAGERIVFIGPSGSGKTSVLRLSMALEHPTEGEVRVFGESYWERGLSDRAQRKRLRRLRRPVGAVFQQYNLFPHMTVLQNMVEAPVGVLGIPKEEAEAAALVLLERVGLSSKQSSYPRQLSGGQQQRVAIARTLMMKPKLLLLDEVTSALDPELVGEVLAVIKDIAAETDVAMLIITHEMKFARDVSHRVCFMADGQILEQGTPEQIFEAPALQRTRDFLSLDGIGNGKE